PEVVTDGTTMHVFWITRTSSGNVGRHQISTDGGATWLPSPLQTPPAPPPGGEQPFARGDPSLLLLANHGSLLHRSTDGGQTWTPLTGLLMPIVYDVAHEGQTIVVVGVDYAAPLTWYIQTSLDGGSTWQAPAFAATAASGFGATAHIAAGQLYVNFWHGSEPTWSIVAYSGDLGASWRTMQSNVSGFGPGPRRNLHLQFVGGPPGPTAAYAYVGLGWTPRGVGSAGAGGRVPQLSLSAPPILGTTTSLDVADAVGGTVGVLGLSLQPPAGVPLAGGTLWVQPPLVPILLPIGGPTGVAGAGTAAEPFAVPNVPALAGTALASQAVVLDGQAVGGLALSNAIEWFVN
ncbi:MAG: exo-alpha-sialidase, partial [Planctomycetes bacterium]|nr:exo-alpha-sialidase [Planctomycetota bacterium]